MATALLDLPPDHSRRVPTGPGPQRPAPGVLTGLLLGQEVVIHTDHPMPQDPVHRLVEDLDAHWDLRRRHSDLDRLTHHPGVARTVSTPTLVLVRNALSYLRLAQRTGMTDARADAILDVRHHRAGLDPTTAAITARLAPATAVDLLVELCRGHGALTGRARVGDVQRELDDAVPAWLRQAAADLHEAMTAPTEDQPGADPAPRWWACSVRSC